LDTHSSEEIMHILQELNREGKTIVLVTHERDIGSHAHRILHFRDGQLVDNETVEQPLEALAVLKEMAEEEKIVEPV
jgi:putative ABC transport system ATP-binding protein